jgi:hypothetical protein
MAGGSGYGYRHGTTSNAAYGPTQGSQTWPIGAVIGCSYDADTGDVRFYNEGVDMGLFDTLPSNTDFYLSAIQNYVHGPTKFNFGQMPFIYTPPTGFKALHLNQLDEPTIKNGKKHFEAIIWDGNDVDDRAITTTEEFAPGLVWIKCRDSTINHFIYDTVRGAPKRLFPNINNQEDTAAGHLKSFTSNGFTLGTSGNVNGIGNEYVAWCWNYNSADPKINGFEIITYTGNATVGRTVSHNLGQAPDFILAKDRGPDGNYWCFYHSAGGVGYGYLNYALSYQHSASSPVMWTATSSTNWTLDANAQVNGSGNNMVAYAWISVEGFSKFGSYNGSGSTDGAFVYLGFKPALVMIKNADAGNGWVMFDSTRDSFNDNDQHSLTPLDSGAETGSYGIDFLSNGFKARDTSGDFNSSAKFLYCAWAENPFGGENAPPVTAR